MRACYKIKYPAGQNEMYVQFVGYFCENLPDRVLSHLKSVRLVLIFVDPRNVSVLNNLTMDGSVKRHTDQTSVDC